MNIVILSDYDAAGNMYNLASGINTYTDHNAVAIKLRYHKTFHYPTTLLATKKNLSKIRKLIYESDAVVFKEEPQIPLKYGIDLKKLRHKPIVFLVGGWGFRNRDIYAKNRRTYSKKNLPNIKWGTTSIDFLEKNPSWGWVPACIRLEELRRTYNYSKLTPPLIVASPSSSTNSMLKMDILFEKTKTFLEDRDLSFQTLFIRNLDNDSCLNAKASASIFFDRIYDIYGINSQEAAAFEAIVITGSSEFTLDKLRSLGFDCPFVIVQNDIEMRERMEELLLDEKRRRRGAKLGLEYIQKLHSGEESAKRLIEMLEG